MIKEECLLARDINQVLIYNKGSFVRVKFLGVVWIFIDVCIFITEGQFQLPFFLTLRKLGKGRRIGPGSSFSKPVLTSYQDILS